MKLIAICAMSDNRCIGNDHKLPWYIPRDLEFFKNTTLHHPVIMGKTTYLSLPKRLENRREIIISTTIEKKEGIEVYSTPEEAIEVLSKEGIQKAFIIGGGRLYRETMGLWDELLLTVVHKTVHGDTFFPKIPKHTFELMFEEYWDITWFNKDPITFQHYRKISI